MPTAVCPRTAVTGAAAQEGVVGGLRGGGHGPAGEGWLTSCALKAFLSVKSSSFHTTSTPSSVSMARKVLWMPGMFP